MNLPFIKKFKKEIPPSYFLVLILRDEKINAVIFEEIQGRVKIIGEKEEYLSSSIDQVASEEFLQTLDKAISSAESSLPENVQTQKTIFGVKESWTDKDQIKKEYLAKLKKASEELGLTPIGFLVISQAISHLMQKEEGAPISAVLAEVNKKNITVTLLRAGKSIETKSSEIHESIPFTVDTVLKHFNIPEILPSRIIIFNGKEDLSQEFISHTWSKSLPFLHIPQITNLPDGFDAKAVLFGAATQMGYEVLGKDIPKEPQASQKFIEDTSQAEAPIQKTETYKNFGENNFGFAKDIDVAKMEFQEPQENPPTGEEEKVESIPQVRKETFPAVSNPTKGIGIVLSKILNTTFLFTKTVTKTLLGFFANMPKSKVNFLIPVFLLLVIATIGSYFLFMSATVEITIDSKIIEQNKSILFSTTSSTDASKNIIKGEFVTVSEDGTVSTSTTGKKDVGTKAKGSVTIFNSLSQSKTLTNGTILKAPNGIEFTLDSTITIKAVASHSADETITPEKTTANVTANQLGKESNLPSGTKFTISTFDTSDLIAKNDNPFEGGTKKEVTVVSKNDEAKLVIELPKQVENKARETLLKEIGNGKVLLPAFISNSLTSKSLSAKIGDEGNELTLTGTVEFQGISYNKNDLITFSKSLLEKDVKPNQEINYNNIKTAVLDIKNKNDEEVEANLNIKALLLPKIDQDKLIKTVKGKSFKDTEDLLYKLPQVADVNIVLSPKIPLLPKNLPIREKNIKIKILIDG